MRYLVLALACLFILFNGCVDVVPQQSIQAVKNGQRLYDMHCANCHQQDGAGLANLIPALNQSSNKQLSVLNLACSIRNGKGGFWNGTSYIKQTMPANAKLSIKEITYIINYVEWYFLKKTEISSEAQVQEALQSCNSYGS
jgi:mono/diheme cytochrome c family protein